MPEDPRSRVDAAAYNHHSSNNQQYQHQARVPELTITTPVEEPALRRPLNLGIATAAANSAARAAASAAQRPPPAQAYNQSNQQQSRVQQKLQRNNNGPPSPLNNSSNNQSVPMSGQSNNYVRSMSPQQQQQRQQQQQQHVPQNQNQQQQPTPRQAGPNGIRPFELRGNAPPQYGGQAPHQQGPPGQQQQQQNRRPDLPILQVTVPPQVHQSSPTRQQPPQQQQQRYNQSGAPFSSSAETLVGANAYEKDKLYNGQSKTPNWSPSSSASSSSHTHGNHVPSTPRSPFAIAAAASGGHPNSPYGHHPPPSPSIKNFSLQVPNGDITADSENDRLSPAMPRLRNGQQSPAASQQDWWKRFSTVVRENEQREQLAEKTGGKGSKVQSEWLDAQAHRQRKHRIWVGVVAFIILAAIGGGLAYHYITKDKDSDNGVTVPTTHGIEISKSGSSTQAATVASSSAVMASPSAVPAGNSLGTRDGIAKRNEREEEALAAPVRLLAARSSIHTGGHARRHKNLHQLD